MEEKTPFPLYVHHVGIYISDMERSLKWYEEMLGFTLAHRTVCELPTLGPVDMASIQSQDHYIELYEFPKNPVGEGPIRPVDFADYMGSLGTKHICLYAKHGEYQGVREHLKSKSVNMVVDIRWPNDQSQPPVSPLSCDADPNQSQDGVRPGPGDVV